MDINSVATLPKLYYGAIRLVIQEQTIEDHISEKERRFLLRHLTKLSHYYSTNSYKQATGAGLDSGLDTRNKGRDKADFNTV
jgi:hypothetical protein